jgi:hypothetical protein
VTRHPQGRQFYGWFDPDRGDWQDSKPGRYCVSRYPPDSPVRPSIEFETAEEAENMIKKQRRGEILWIPALPKKVSARHAG